MQLITLSPDLSISEYPYKFTSELTGKDVVEDDHVEFKIELDEEDGDVKWYKDGVELKGSDVRYRVWVRNTKMLTLKLTITIYVTSFSVFHTEATVSIGLEKVLRMVTSILQN